MVTSRPSVLSARVLGSIGVGLLVALLAAPACGGAIDNELNQKGGTSGSSGGGATTPVPTSSPTPQPTTKPPVPTPVPQPDPNGKCRVRFEKDVLDVFQQANCGNANCHGGSSPRNEPTIDPTMPQLTYKAMVSFTLTNGQPYVVVGNPDPTASGLHCNLTGNGAICGVAMPLPMTPLTKAQLALVDEWLACGAPLN